MFTYKITVKMYDTDAAGILFFGNQFKWVHEAYEEFLESINFSFSDILKTDFFVPIVHAEADYKAPLSVGDRITIQVKIDKIGQSSFTITYNILDTNKHVTVGTAKTVHVTVDKQTRKKIAIPTKLREALTKAA